MPRKTAAKNSEPTEPAANENVKEASAEAAATSDVDRDNAELPEENRDEIEHEPDRPEFNDFDAAFAEEVDVEDQNNHLGDGDDEIADYSDHNPVTLISSFAQKADENVVDWAAVAAENQRARQEEIQAAVRDALAQMGINQSSDVAPKSDFVPHKFKYHFRNDVSPSVKIQAMDMSAIDRGERPQDNPLYGHWYEFHVGHFQTDDENAARQLKWMMSNVPVDAQGQTVGGNLAIYEDDNSVIFRCPQCDFVTASPAGYKAHRRATHGEA